MSGENSREYFWIKYGTFNTGNDYKILMTILNRQPCLATFFFFKWKFMLEYITDRHLIFYNILGLCLGLTVVVVVCSMSPYIQAPIIYYKFRLFLNKKCKVLAWISILKTRKNYEQRIMSSFPRFCCFVDIKTMKQITSLLALS